MRVTAPILAIACIFALRLAGLAAIGIEQIAPAEAPAVDARGYSENESAGNYEKQRNLRLEAHRRAQMQKRALGIAAIVAPIVLIAGATFAYFRVKNANSHQATHKKLKQLEARRRAGRPVEEAIDPRRW